MYFSKKRFNDSATHPHIKIDSKSKRFKLMISAIIVVVIIIITIIIIIIINEAVRDRLIYIFPNSGWFVTKFLFL